MCSAIGCTECCPFCGAPCELTIIDHNEQHFTNNHKIKGIYDTIAY